MVAGARYGVISNNGKTITIVTFGSVDAIGVDEVLETRPKKQEIAQRSG
jgi:hypothetical protein